MMYPECSYHFHPRNKNMVLGAIIEAIYYSQINKGRPDPSSLPNCGPWWSTARDAAAVRPFVP